MYVNPNHNISSENAFTDTPIGLGLDTTAGQVLGNTFAGGTINGIETFQAGVDIADNTFDVSNTGGHLRWYTTPLSAYNASDLLVLNTFPPGAVVENDAGPPASRAIVNGP